MNLCAKCILVCFSLAVIFILVAGKGSNVKDNTVLLYSTAKDICMVNLTRGSKSKPVTLVKNLTDCASLDFLYAEKKICWVDHGAESVQCSQCNSTETYGKVDVISTEVLSPAGLACDWFTNKLYWTDSEAHKIEVASIQEKYRKVLFWSDLDQPRSIALAPMKGLMFWTDWGETPKIERAYMDGNLSSRTIIVNNDNIFWPNDLSIDYETETIYWIDGKLCFIDRIDYDGKNRKRILKNAMFQYPFGLTHISTKLYWTDWQTWKMYMYDQSNAEKPKEILHSDFVPNDLHIWDARKQPMLPHPCENNNGNCSHLCLLTPVSPGYTCGCPIGVKLLDNLTCSDGSQEILILARRTEICVIYLDSPDHSHKVLALNNVKYAIAVDYDPISGFIYWTDEEVTKIQKAKLDGSAQSDVITTEIESPDGIAIDWVARNLYWTDAGTDRIEVVTLDGQFRKVLIWQGLFDPRAIAVAPNLGWMFWSDWYVKKPKIERANLDGSERMVIISSDIGWPNGVTLDLVNSKIYWCDGKTHKIEFSNMDGSDRRVLINDNMPHTFGITIMNDYIYWTDWTRRAIERVHKQSGNHREIIREMANVMGVKAVSLKEKVESNPCTDSKGGCDQICLYRHNKTYVCTCEINYELKRDGKSCILSDAFLLTSTKESIEKISVESESGELLPITGIKQISSLDIDANNMRIYWSDTKLRKIMRSYINGSDPQKVIDLGLASPEGVAIDWIVHNIYWSDPMAHRIEVARLGGSSRRTLLWKHIDEPHSIAINPQEGYIYWSEWGNSNKIKKAGMNGTNPINLLMNTGFAIGLTLDMERKKLYWAERSTPAISYANLNGLNRRVLWSEKDSKPIGLSVYKNLLFWADEYTRHVWKMDTTNPESKSVIYTMSETPTDLVAVYKKKDRIFNQCAVNNGDCSHLCLTIPGENLNDPVSFTCACPTHYILQNNTCIPPKKFMIYSQRNLAVRLLPDTDDCLEAVLPIQGLKTVKAIGYDPVQHYLYWIEGRSKSIKRADATGMHISIIVPSHDSFNPFDLAIDSLGRLLFWSCDSQDVINVTRLDNSSTVGVVVSKKGEKPRLLAIHPTKRLLFYSDVGTTPQLVRARMDGSQRVLIAKGEIAALAVDTENDLVVWAQGHSIHMSNIDGDNQHVLLNESNSRIIQLTIHSGWLYWLDREIQQLQRLELKTGGSRFVVLNHASHILDLVSVKLPEKNHVCNQPLSKRCSHLCIVDGSSAVCACPQGLALQEDKKTCVSLPNCGSDYFTCSTPHADSKDCIPVKWRCDGQEDCPDKSDEAGCSTCSQSEFRCSNGNCIDSKYICDGIAQCSDRSDEERCCKKDTEFQCPQTEVCIPRNLLCDGTENCANGADESKETCKDANIASPQSTLLIIIFSVLSAVVGFILVYVCLRRKLNITDNRRDPSEDLLNPVPCHTQIKPIKLRNGIPDVVHMSMLNGSESYDRNHITGASSSTNGSSSLTCYPRETLNPPPSPATTTNSTRGHSPNSRYRPYRHYRSINQPPPPTPCSTDVADESDYNYPTRRYEVGWCPPPPTPRSHCHSESCPPSPSSRSSTYFSPLPPPPSPVASQARGYDS